jgi:hypothetical protein
MDRFPSPLNSLPRFWKGPTEHEKMPSRKSHFAVHTTLFYFIKKSRFGYFYCVIGFSIVGFRIEECLSAMCDSVWMQDRSAILCRVSIFAVPWGFSLGGCLGDTIVVV